MIMLVLGLIIWFGLIIFFIYAHVNASVFDRLGFKDCDISIDKINLRYHSLK